VLYHADIGFPSTVKLPATRIHALQAAQDDRYGTIDLPAVLDTQAAELIEIETDGQGRIVKALYRLPHNDRCDLLMAVLMGRRYVKTVWLNDRNDAHTSLDRLRYTTPPA
jgi:hypothetical protein